MVEEVDQPSVAYDEQDDAVAGAVTDDSWPPKSGLSHRFPRAEEDEFWGETSRGSQQGWNEPEHPAEPEPDLQPESTETSGQVRAVSSDWREPARGSPSPTSSPTGPTHRRRRRASTASSSRTTSRCRRRGRAAARSRCRTGPSRRRARSRASSPATRTPTTRMPTSTHGRRSVGRCRASAPATATGPRATSTTSSSSKDDSMTVGALSEADAVDDDDAEFDEEVAARRRGSVGTVPEGPERCDRRAAGRRPPRRSGPPARGASPSSSEATRCPPRAPATPAPAAPAPTCTTRVITGVGIAVVALVCSSSAAAPRPCSPAAIVVGLAAFELYEALPPAGLPPGHDPGRPRRHRDRAASPTRPATTASRRSRSSSR